MFLYIFAIKLLFCLYSSVPHTVHDLMPRIEKIATIVTNLPNEVLSYTAALEENLGKNLEKCMKDIMKGSLGVRQIYIKYQCKVSLAIFDNIVLFWL